MSWRSRPDAWALALVLAAALPEGAAAQGAARGWSEAQVFGIAVGSRPPMYGGGIGIGWRDAGRTRISGALAAGATDDGRAAGRFELSWFFLLDPAKRSGLSVYGGGGVAASLVEKDNVKPWLQAVIGIETSPAARSSFFIEGGFGGGARGAVGLRVRSRKGPG